MSKEIKLYSSHLKEDIFNTANIIELFKKIYSFFEGKNVKFLDAVDNSPYFNFLGKYRDIPFNFSILGNIGQQSTISVIVRYEEI